MNRASFLKLVGAALLGGKLVHIVPAEEKLYAFPKADNIELPSMNAVSKAFHEELRQILRLNYTRLIGGIK